MLERLLWRQNRDSVCLGLRLGGLGTRVRNLLAEGFHWPSSKRLGVIRHHELYWASWSFDALQRSWVDGALNLKRDGMQDFACSA